MAAESIKPKNQRITKPTRKPTKTGEIILKTKTEHPDLTTREIAAIANCSHVNVIETLKRYNYNTEHIEGYKNTRADIFAGLQDRLLAGITDADLSKTSMKDRVWCAAVIYDKERLERGKASSQVEHFGVIVHLPGRGTTKQDAIDIQITDDKGRRSSSEHIGND